MSKQPQTRQDVLAGIAAHADGKPKFGERVFRHAPERTGRPAPAPSNGGPRIYETPVEELRDIGLTLYAPDAWIPRLANDIGENPRQVRKWVAGQSKVPPIALHRARLAIKEHMARMQKLLVRLGEAEA